MQHRKKLKNYERRLPEVPLPLAFSGMSLHTMLQKQQFATEKAELEQYYQEQGVQQWQEGYNAGEQATGQSSSLELGYEAGWKKAAKLNFEVGYNNGFMDGAKIALTGDNFIVVDKKNPRNLTSALDKDCC